MSIEKLSQEMADDFCHCLVRKKYIYYILYFSEIETLLRNVAYCPIKKIIIQIEVLVGHFTLATITEKHIHLKTCRYKIKQFSSKASSTSHFLGNMENLESCFWVNMDPYSRALSDSDLLAFHNIAHSTFNFKYRII